MLDFKGIMVAGFGLLLGLSAQAATIDGTVVIPDCSQGGCTWSMRGGSTSLSGTYTIDRATGALTLVGGQNQRLNLAGGGYVQLGDLTGNADPILGFSASASTAGVAGNTFAFNFSLPIALTGALSADSSVSYSLSSLTRAAGGGAQISPLFGHVVVAQEVDSSVGGLSPLNKGVDVGDTFSFLSATPLTQNSPVYTATSSLTGDLAYDLMSVTVAFSLSANSTVGLSGFVEQIPVTSPVPVPAAVWLLGSALGMLGWIRRIRS